MLSPRISGMLASQIVGEIQELIVGMTAKATARLEPRQSELSNEQITTLEYELKRYLRHRTENEYHVVFDSSAERMQSPEELSELLAPTHQRTLWRKMNITLVALIAGIAFAHIALLAGVVFLMATTDFKPEAPLLITLASVGAGYIVPMGIFARAIFKTFGSSLREASTTPDPETP